MTSRYSSASASRSAFDINWKALQETAPISKAVQQHLARVYTALTAMILISGLGVVFDIKYHVGGVLTFIASIGLLIAIHVTPHEPQTMVKRAAMLGAFSFLEGVSLGQMIEYVYALDPSIIANALLGTVCVFACFSVSAIFSTRRSYLYLGGLLSSGLSLLLWLSFLNIFFRSSLLMNVQLYMGLMVFIGFVMFDTQLIIEKANQGSTDFITHALGLFLDFVNIFVRLLRILSKLSTDDKKKKR